jgi:hypothetical protein
MKYFGKKCTRLLRLNWSVWDPRFPYKYLYASNIDK